MTDILRRIQIRVPDVPTVWTLELAPVATTEFSTLTALLTRILRGYFLDANAFFLSVVRDELLEFGERPRVDAGPPATVTTVFEVFEFDDRITELTGILHQLC
ncbi:MAG: hypothetical protein J07HQW2_00453 [Haloquadratum walsbyi J07HQW2]|uniref:Uncharacterized protein n=1 Tax=Haloquadratum walsbyi J07HQW2 TaxID=1238425 RepID=U1MUK1_9EURY|nr:MAG: hypothetical protein J07HQW2_00453 [Haloquadratum walsbyi J07HQW2]